MVSLHVAVRISREAHYVNVKKKHIQETAC